MGKKTDLKLSTPRGFDCHCRREAAATARSSCRLGLGCCGEGLLCGTCLPVIGKRSGTSGWRFEFFLKKPFSFWREKREDKFSLKFYSWQVFFGINLECKTTQVDLFAGFWLSAGTANLSWRAQRTSTADLVSAGWDSLRLVAKYILISQVSPIFGYPLPVVFGSDFDIHCSHKEIYTNSSPQSWAKSLCSMQRAPSHLSPDPPSCLVEIQLTRYGDKREVGGDLSVEQVQLEKGTAWNKTFVRTPWKSTGQKEILKLEIAQSDFQMDTFCGGSDFWWFLKRN